MRCKEGPNVISSNLINTHISAKQLRLLESVKYSPKSSCTMSLTLCRNGRIRRRVSHHSDSDAGWNSTQHPTWPQALSEEFTLAVNGWWMALRCFDIYRHCGSYTHMFGTEPSPLKWPNGRVLCAWNNGLMLGGKFPNTKGMLGGNLGDAGSKLYGEVRKRPEYLNWAFANSIYNNNSVSRNQVVPFVHWDSFQHTKLSCEFLQILHLIRKHAIDIKKLKEGCNDIYALIFTMDLRRSRRSDQKNYNIFFFKMR